MSAAIQYKALLNKVASRTQPNDIAGVYRFCMAKQASATDSLLWAAAGGLPAYLMGRSMGKDDEKKKHKNYALAGAAAGFLTPKLLNALINPSSAFPSVSGFDASDIKNLQLASLD
jgi:hypothetical protein